MAARAALTFAGAAAARGSSGYHAYYGGGHQTSSHGRPYIGGCGGSSHMGGHYHSPYGGRHDGRHKPA